jgi:carbon storage regulator
MEGIEMLVFTRRVGETIVINGDIEVTIVRVGPNDVRIGIVAPAEIPVARNELEPGDVQEIRIGKRPSVAEPRIANRR